MNITNDFKNRFNNPFTALKHKNFRYYWIGMCVSLIGTWMQNIAQPWLAYTLTNSPFLLSLIGIVQFTPMLIFSLFAGVIIDKFSKKKILLFTQTASLVITLVLAILVWTGKIQYWHILIMATMLGIVNTIDMPSRQSIIIELVGKEDLMNAIALNSMVFNLARIVGPAIAGIVMGYAGIAVCFFANSISFAAVVVGLFFIKINVVKRGENKETRILAEIKDGLKYIYRKKVLLHTILILAIVGTFVPNFNVLVPVFAKEILNQGEAGFGLLMSFMGFGSFLGAMCVAALSKSGPKKFIIYFVPLIVAMLLIATGYTNIYLLTGIFLALTGFFFICFTSSANSTLQLNSKNEYRGRVMSVYTLVFAGSTPFGNLYAGLFAEHFNARVGFAACGGIIILLMIPLLFVKKIRGL
ncbi:MULTISPECIES: MFS transporter [Clostridium]|uniref:Arabinose efflux permease n=1 Tax=Clostridium saccharoperbutylacetonicum N1-4(HMT) TaxID=931276 RepID=M1MPH1_9CLOT|nr:MULTISPECIES: MFS transporter [Clostridium]AGF58118.1 arabinose efflux permease [Clostridium saccharoperbutylacetonicum N1-4(HMT)]AQR96807.1 putative bacilysin exporter BacE [Clostridium saccharoperbutylacetonicum]NRT61108.1 MFS family permease [Clostridium saccharoperbutylacetonicum]NSB24423.1 MFS family permease [Clostridium saccharoperbutylacetonicum]NSB32685.1 MFS family permease [Clostridium saccharoperbutylacetonicum]